MTTIEVNKSIALTWIDAFNAHDLQSLLALYAEDAIHFSPKLKMRDPSTNGWLKGKQSLQKWWADAFNRLPLLQYELKNTIINDKQILLEYLRKVPDEPDIMVAEILEIEAGLITASRVYHG